MTLRQVGNYRLESLLGVGGMGEVYKAYDTRRDRYVALKLLPEALSGDEEFLKRFQRESNVAARLRDPHVIPIHDFGEIDGQLFIDMRLVDGADIFGLLETYGRITPQRAVYLISQVAEALDAAHADHLVHRDIKPSNILVTASDFVYVVDFGIARSIGGPDTPLTNPGVTLGTLNYMAPERFKGHDVDGRADVYSLACVLHECLTGAPPFSGREMLGLMYAQIHFDPPPASSLVEGLPPALDAVIARGMAKDPKDRFPTAGALASAARQALLAEAPVPPMTELPVPPMTELPVPPMMKLPVPPMTELPADTRIEIPDLTWQAADAAAASQGGPEPPGRESESAADPSAQGVSFSPTQTVTADSVDDSSDKRPPENGPPVTSPDPGVATGSPARGPARRRRGVLILAAAAAVAATVALVLMVSAKPRTGGAATTHNAGGATSAGTTGKARLALPAIAETVPAGKYPSYVQVAPNGKFAYITDSGARVITVLNTATDRVSGTVPITQGPPQFISFSPDSRTAYVSVYSTARKSAVHLIVFVDTATGKETGTVQVNNHMPGPSAISQDGRYLYVPNHEMVMGGTGDNDIDVIDTATQTLIKTIPVLANPHWIIFGKNGQIYVSDHMSARVTVLNAGNVGGFIKTISVGETPHSEALSPDGSRLAVTSYDGNEVFLINTATDQMIKQIPVGTEPLDITYSPDGRYLFTVNNLNNTVTVIDTADYSVIGEVRTGKAPTSISVLPNGRQAYVTDEGDANIEILNIAK